jgi:hypothetical protein
LGQLPAGFGGGAVQFGAQLRLGRGNARLGEVVAHLGDHIGFAWRFKIRRHDGLSMGLRRVSRFETQLAGGPQPEQPVAPRGNAERKLLVALEFGLERLSRDR